VKFLIATAFVVLYVLGGAVSSAAQEHKPEKHISIKEYEAFHRVLHPLQHDALPKKDYETIRNHADELLSKGNAVVDLGVPTGTREDDRGRFESTLQHFSSQLKALKKHAKEGSDLQVKESFDAVHDSFELLVSMLPASR